MKYAIKAPDGNYMRWPGENGSSHTHEAGWNSDLENADLYDSQEDARYRIEQYAIGKWNQAAIVPIIIAECLIPELLTTDYFNP